VTVRGPQPSSSPRGRARRVDLSRLIGLTARPTVTALAEPDAPPVVPVPFGLKAYRSASKGGVEELPAKTPLAEAIWIDLFEPSAEDAGRMLGELGIQVPSAEDMEEIEVSNRFYRENGIDVMTVILPGHSVKDGSQVTGPVSFILMPDRLITVRHHAPRPFDTFPNRADRSSTGCADHRRLFLGLVEEIVSRFADHLEAASRTLDVIAARVYAGAREELSADELEEALRAIGRQGELLARVRLGILTVDLMLAMFSLWGDGREGGESLKGFVKTLARDLQSLGVHGDFLGNRVGLATDTTLGMVNLSQNQTVRIVSVVATLFLPPTLIGTIYGMNFDVMPELAWAWGYPAALIAMFLSAGASWAYFRWKGWL
jgi:magnesium transporter